MAEKILEVKDLQVSFKTQGGILKAVRNISFDLNKGETLAIVGESGSGKSVTSKAIIGILAGNSIVEGGEIIYDGQDLLKIDEERFHKIRGDKISMIFQDPLSSLNPIMRVGQQITEAMILNGKARQKSARNNFNSYLKVLNQNMNIASPDKVGYNNNACKTFNAFCVLAGKNERKYDDAYNAAVSLSSILEETSFLISKNQPIKMSAFLSQFNKLFAQSQHFYVLNPTEEILSIQSQLNSLGKDYDKKAAVDLMNSLNNIVKDSLKKEHPNFFRLGYYELMNPGFVEDEIDVKAVDERNLTFLNDNFMNEFITEGSKAIVLTHKVACERKNALKQDIISFIDLLENSKDLVSIKKEVFEQYKHINAGVKAAIDPLVTNRNTVEYSFGISFLHELKRYFEGVKINPKNNRKYERSKAKFDALVASGKAPTWQVIPPYLVNLELCKENLVSILKSIVDCYEKQTSRELVPNEEMIALIDFFKDQCSRFVYTVTQSLAKAKALDLLKEVGIPEPAIRYRQYPFEFSGGMRQRIVIAIALSANPDILICDEPTTALDVTIQSQILELINKIKKERKLSVIFITHDLGVVANMADRIAVMYAGKIVETGTADDIFYDPRHPYTWALLSSMPDLDTKEKLEAIPGTPPNMIYPPKGDAFAERNKYALEIDFEKDPPLFEVSPTHYAATWLLHPNAPKVDMPQVIKDRIERMKKGDK